MRAVTLLFVAALAVQGCSSPGAQLHGTLAEGWPEGPLFASVEGGPERVAILGDAFSFPDLPAGAVRLGIASGADELARIDVQDLPAGASLSLERIRRQEEQDLAFPSTVRVEGADVITINGIRMAAPGALPERVDAEGVVLAVGAGESALIVRPRSAELPDLAVVVTPATRVLDARDEEASLERLSEGAAVRVEGRAASGYLMAETIRLGDAPDAESLDRTPRDAMQSGERVSGDRDTGERLEQEEGRGARGRGASERGRPQIPKGHRPPPGECRDLDPRLPPGQQKPPRKC